ncbi:hypothetical protein PLICRDRAFT_47381 [Plicaturopsis crispa FD-325 SS-3]|uniref:Protein-S-isoprenylcysteine O-methyltransferase n=1 Tax=Plicaturopsis crispa FD-325 SS-3 TaxID=944288 RepID=A0A0C9SQ22_PLICR|nr:hypothetical protein PLICRDRAFT_47381 [Plicaturopsis crispa FD-325 SS-3]
MAPSFALAFASTPAPAMSASRAVFTAVQAVSCTLAWTPPRKTPEKGRYNTDALKALQIAPLIFGLQSYVVYAVALLETLALVSPSLLESSPLLSPLSNLSCPTSSPSAIHVTPAFILGTFLVVSGAALRLKCFGTLGQLFTFDLTIHPSHTLVTSGPYAWVRHPSYTGSMMMVAGVAIALFTPGGWVNECLVGGAGGVAAFTTGKWALYALWASWWSWTVSVGVTRARAEDGEMRKLFGAEWDAWSARVNSWFVPGIW